MEGFALGEEGFQVPAGEAKRPDSTGVHCGEVAGCWVNVKASSQANTRQQVIITPASPNAGT